MENEKQEKIYMNKRFVESHINDLLEAHEELITTKLLKQIVDNYNLVPVNTRIDNLVRFAAITENKLKYIKELSIEHALNCLKGWERAIARESKTILDCLDESINISSERWWEKDFGDGIKIDNSKHIKEKE